MSVTKIQYLPHTRLNFFAMSRGEMKDESESLTISLWLDHLSTNLSYLNAAVTWTVAAWIGACFLQVFSMVEVEGAWIASLDSAWLLSSRRLLGLDHPW